MLCVSPFLVKTVSFYHTMKNDDTHKFERIASALHGEDIEQTSEIQEISKETREFTDARKIYEVKDVVAQLGRLKSEDRAWEEVKYRLKPKRAIDWTQWLKYAAVFIGTLVLNTIVINYYNPMKSADQNSAFATITSPRGQITSMTLFDGTTVWLNSGSSLKYSNQFGISKREVTLEGEALFEVKKDQKKVFVVNLGTSSIEVHGTVFNAKNYPLEKEVVLLEGKVDFLNQGKLVEMSPNDRIIVNKNTEQITIDQVNAPDYKSWIGGKINFDNETLEDLVLRLERWYDIEFEFEKPNIKHYKFSGVINKDKSLAYTLRIIELTNKVKFKKESDKIYITE